MFGAPPTHVGAANFTYLSIIAFFLVACPLTNHTKILPKLCATLPLEIRPLLCYNLIVGWGYGNPKQEKKKVEKNVKKLLTNRTDYGIISTSNERKR
jgi:hypothetical protein